MANRTLAVVASAALASAGLPSTPSAARAPALTPVRPAAQVPVRVVSLVPGATQALYAIGAGDRVVGVSDFDDWPAAVRELPKIGGLVDPNLEAILGLRPDLAIVDPAHAALSRQLASAGIATYSYATADLAGVAGHLRRLGLAMGLETAGERAAVEFEDGLERVRAATSALPRPRVILAFGRRPGSFAELWINGGDGFLAEILEIAGGDNVFADVERPSFKAGLEAVLSRVPDIVIEAGEPGSEASARATRQWRSLPGFSEVRVVSVDLNWMLIPGPRLGEAAAEIARLLHEAP